ncbi:MAG TPA: glycosyltransferase family 4 protein [Steroidobacteraceae bacterium]|jgi:glycosyltransferase involved in cell wall biosynthesis|nr:glycosyltransferase family 4 protein [Steroidobacteraceae bacterium]
MSESGTALRIAQVAPLYESVPPKLYGGTERVVSYLTEELVRQGHRVTLFASGDSRTSAKLVAVCAHAARLERDAAAAVALHTLLVEAVFAHPDGFDVIHCHTDSIHLPLARRCPIPVITTLHGRLDIAALDPLHREFTQLPLVSISNAQRAPLPWASWAGTVYHGLPLELHRPHYDVGKYLVFLGRISPEKRLDRAIAIARRAGLPLRIAAKIDRADHEYFASQIQPLLAGPGIEYLGEIDECAKTQLLGGALALLFPIDWPEPFGLAMIEAMACGTPVIAFPCGAVPEVIDSGITGYIVTSIEEAVACVERARGLDRRECRRQFERRFCAARMAREYCSIYRNSEARWCRRRA